MEKIKLNYFRSRLECCKSNRKGNPGTHSYTLFEDVVGYYCSITDMKDDETIARIVRRINQFEPDVQENKLTTSSFKKKILNMNSFVTNRMTGLHRSASQGDYVAKEIAHLGRTYDMTRFALKDLINEHYNGEII